VSFLLLRNEKENTMGFLKKLFEKKDCEICGGEIGLLGNKKLVDGDMCKDCAAKLSPWFTDRKESTVAEIKEQLAYREANQNELRSNFKATKSFGDYYKMHVMYENGQPTRFVVSSSANYIEDNADIIKFTDVVSCDIDIRDSKTEQKRLNENNERVSYNPPRYEFRYEFYVKLGINNPYFDEIRFKVNRSTVVMISELMTHRASSGIGQFLLSNNDFDPTYNPEFRQYQQICDEIVAVVQQGQNPQTEFKMPDDVMELERQLAFGEKVMAEEDNRKKLALYEEEYARVKDNPALAEYSAIIANQVKSLQYVCMTPEEQAAKMTELMQQKQAALMQEAGVPGQNTASASAAAAPASSGKCPGCGAENQKGKFCEFCGTKIV